MKAFIKTLVASGVDRTGMAKEVGVHRSHLYRLEHGQRQATVPVACRLLAFLNRPENLKKLGREERVTFEELFTAAPAKTSEAAA